MLDNKSQLNIAFEQYLAAFGQNPPIPFGVDDETLLEVINKYLKKNKPIPKSYDWYKNLPPGACA